MFKLDIENFRKIRKASLEVEGLVWITGPNDQGKSCLLKAIPAMIENKSGNSFITYGEKYTKVDLQIPSKGIDITWEKPLKGSGTYTVGKEVLTKTGSSIPSEVLDLGFKVITIKDKKYNLHFWPQASYFLVRDTPSYIFLMISRLLKHKSFIPMLKQMKVDHKAMQKTEVELSGQFKLLDTKRQRIEESLEMYEDFDSHEVLYEDLIIKYEFLSSCSEVLTRVNFLILDFSDVTDRLGAIATVRDNLILIPKVKDQIQLYITVFDIYGRMCTLHSDIADIPENILAYVPLDLESLREQQIICLDLQNVFLRHEKVLDSIQQTPRIFESYIPLDLEPLRESLILYKKLKDVEKRIYKLSERMQEEPEDILAYKGLDISKISSMIKKKNSVQDLVYKLRKIKKELEQVSESEETASKELAVLEEAKQDLYIEFPVCPVCGSSWTESKE